MGSAELVTIFKEPTIPHVLRNITIYGESACKVSLYLLQKLCSC